MTQLGGHAIFLSDRDSQIGRGETVADLLEREHTLPEEQDQELASIKLQTMGLGIDTLTDEQRAYADDYSAGT